MPKPQSTALVKQESSFTLQPTLFVESSLPADHAWRDLSALQQLSTSALKQGTHVMAGPGAGKSRWLGRVPAWMAFLREEPLVVIDPTGAVIDNLCDKIVRLPWELQPGLWQRILYIDAGAQDYVVPTPLYYRLGQADSLFASANRFPAVLKKQDPELQSAPILGWNSLYECAIYAGQIATALGQQLDFVVDLLDHPDTYKGELRQVLAERPELLPAVTYFRELMDPSNIKLREKRIGSFKNKLLPFLSDPTLLATFAGTKKRLNWQRAIQKRQAVLIDLRNERDPDRRQFKMIWYLKTFTDYIKYRGMAGRGQEVMLIIDEITDMLDQRTEKGHSILAGDIEELVTRLGRNFGVNVIIAHQNLSQLDERLQNVLMQMGTQLIGQLSHPDDLERVARQFLTYDPYKLKKTERVWQSVTIPRVFSRFYNDYTSDHMSVPTVVDTRTVEFTPEEQLLLLINKLHGIGRFQFLAKIATGEGEVRGALKKLSIARLDPDQYPNEHVLAPLRRQLAQRDGVPVATLLAEIRAKQRGETPQKHKKLRKQPATMELLPVPQPTETHVPENPLPVTADAAAAVPIAAAPPEAVAGGKDEAVWQ